MSISDAHSAAARENGAQSHGPVTDEGKARSSQNARKLGLFGPVLFLNDHEEETYQALLEGYLEEFRPESIVEHRCVREMVNAEWRLANLRDAMIGYECSQTDPSLDSVRAARAASFGRMADAGNALPLALRYERQFQRQFERALQALTAARRQRELERKSTAHRNDQAMMSMLKSIMDTPPPGLSEIRKRNLQNEPKPPAPNPQNPPFNPAVHTTTAPNSTIPNLYKG